MSRSAIMVVLAVVLLAAPATAHDKVGTVSFPTSCSPAVQADFDRAVALLHSFAFQGSTRGFQAVAERDPRCAMAHWGIAMNALGNPFAWPPSAKGLADGSAAIERAQAIGAPTPRERDYIAALAAFYRDHQTVDHRTRAVAYERAMEQLAARYPADREAAVFHALALNAVALPSDKTYANQLRAAAILERIFAEQPEHPGVAHYLIHSYDYPPIAERGLHAARRYAGIAPAAPHALHMPSHIFTRRGHWEESIASNRASAAAATNDFDRLHAMDYLAYAHLQRAEDGEARKVLEAMTAVGKPNVEHFVTAYALAAIPSRYALERGDWAEAARLALPLRDTFPWARFPQSEAVLVFARGLGAARHGDAAAARRDAERLVALRDQLATATQPYWAEQVEIQRRVVEAWATWAEGRRDAAVGALRAAADMEDATEKHPVTPGPIVPARELLGEILLEAGRPAEALRELEASMAIEPNRFRALAAAARAATAAGDTAKARDYHGRLVALAGSGASERPELREARRLLGGR
ncbi:MAG TPA: hypothetical protein VNN07_06745 [Candidatus Tectomicrobia bacterium]|nr:hypothetical protein [Candidatus Tectomicrobia bacterium]